MGFIDPAFKNIKIGQPIFIIWRVENFEIKPVQSTRYGSFFGGDSYIIYSAAPPVERLNPGQVKNYQGKLEYHIHFWLGTKTTLDESTTAAIKSVELDEILGGLGVQHREIQGYESLRFKSYFKNGIRVLNGGIASGLHHVTDDFKARLFKIKGKRRPTFTEQPSVSWHYFNSGDVFILETKKNIFVWVGKDSNKMEKFQAGKIAAQLRSENPDKVIVHVDEDYEGQLKGDDLEEFESHLSLADRTIKPAEQDGNDSQVETDSIRKIKLFRCTDQNGTFNTTLVKEGPLKQSDLSSEDSFIVDNNVNGLWVWIGKKASDQERTKGMSTAVEFIKNNNYPHTTQVTRVVENAEPIEFQMLFIDWTHPNVVTDNSQLGTGKTVNMNFDAATLHDTPSLAAKIQLVDNGCGTTQVWRLNKKELEDVPEDDFGVFFSGDCYLIQYNYEVHGKQNQILYFWLGAHSSQDERGTIAWHAVKKNDELSGSVLVRVVQSKEPPHFLLIFKGKMIVFKGGYASGFDGPNGKNVGIPSQYLIQVRGGEEHTTQSVEVEFSAASLNTNDVFVLHTENKSYVWCGKGSTGDERERAKIIAEERSKTKEYQLLFEGHESEDFWNVLGGQKPYANNERLSNPDVLVPARLFHCSNASGYFKAEEIFDFNQQDLFPNDVMVLDIGKAVFIWIGKGANKTERMETPKLVEEYLRTDPRGRDLDIPVMTVYQDNEPPTFTGFFGVWDKSLWETSMYQELASDVPEESKYIKNNKKGVSGPITKYPIEVLANKTVDELPDDVDVLHRELHLSEDDFIAAFGIKRPEFDALPSWKQNSLKKSVGLF